jgi:hypothetical protein
MNWAWVASLDHFWRSSTFPMWLTLAAAGFFGILVLVTLVRAEKSVANGALTVITLLAVGIAVAATIRPLGFPSGGGVAGETRPVAAADTRALPAMSCLDDLAGDVVLAACEKAVFASPESTAAATSYVALQISRITALGDAASATQMTPELEAVRRSIEHDRYGLVAQVLQARDRCTPTECAAFHSLTDNHQIITNMDEHVYEGLVNRYAVAWNAPPLPTTAGVPGMGGLAGYPPSMPTGRPTNADFPSSASTPPVSIMSPEPGTGTPAPHSASAPTAAAAPSPRPSPTPSQTATVAAAKKPKPAPKQHPSPAPASTQISPAPSTPAASND